MLVSAFQENRNDLNNFCERTLLKWLFSGYFEFALLKNNVEYLNQKYETKSNFSQKNSSCIKFKIAASWPFLIAVSHDLVKFAR